MKLNSMTFSEADDGESYPDSVTVTMTIEEAIWLALVSGQQKGSSPHSEIYSCMQGDVFNRYWEDGVSEANQKHNVQTPPIRYED